MFETKYSQLYALMAKDSWSQLEQQEVTLTLELFTDADGFPLSDNQGT